LAELYLDQNKAAIENMKRAMKCARTESEIWQYVSLIALAEKEIYKDSDKMDVYKWVKALNEMYSGIVPEDVLKKMKEKNDD
jgi:DNA-binding SARP family transcriptional activator